MQIERKRKLLVDKLVEIVQDVTDSEDVSAGLLAVPLGSSGNLNLSASRKPSMLRPSQLLRPLLR